MKPLRIVATLLAIASTMALYAKKPDESIVKEMKQAAFVYAHTNNNVDRKTALEVMNDLDRKFKRKNAEQLWQQLDTATATSRDYRRIGIVLAVSGEDDYSRWCFYRGALLGDPYCVNYTLIDMLKSEQDPHVALDLMQLTHGITPPLMHNLALAFSQIDDAKVQEAAKTLANMYFDLMSDTEVKYGPYDTDEYIHFLDDPDLKMLRRSWGAPYNSKSVGLALKKWLKK